MIRYSLIVIRQSPVPGRNSPIAARQPVFVVHRASRVPAAAQVPDILRRGRVRFKARPCIPRWLGPDYADGSGRGAVWQHVRMGAIAGPASQPPTSSMTPNVTPKSRPALAGRRMPRGDSDCVAPFLAIVSHDEAKTTDARWQLPAPTDTNRQKRGNGRGDWTRTSDLLNPIQARYQTAPRPDAFATSYRTTSVIASPHSPLSICARCGRNDSAGCLWRTSEVTQRRGYQPAALETATLRPRAVLTASRNCCSRGGFASNVMGEYSIARSIASLSG